MLVGRLRQPTTVNLVDRLATVVSGGMAPAANINGNVAPDTFTYVMAVTGAMSSTGSSGFGNRDSSGRMPL